MDTLNQTIVWTNDLWPSISTEKSYIVRASSWVVFDSCAVCGLPIHPGDHTARVGLKRAHSRCKSTSFEWNPAWRPKL